MSRNTRGRWVVDQEGQSPPRYRIPPAGPRASPCSRGPFPWSCRWRQRYDRTLKIYLHVSENLVKVADISGPVGMDQRGVRMLGPIQDRIRQVKVPDPQ